MLIYKYLLNDSIHSNKLDIFCLFILSCMSFLCTPFIISCLKITLKLIMFRKLQNMFISFKLTLMHIMLIWLFLIH